MKRVIFPDYSKYGPVPARGTAKKLLSSAPATAPCPMMSADRVVP